MKCLLVQIFFVVTLFAFAVAVEETKVKDTGPVGEQLEDTVEIQPDDDLKTDATFFGGFYPIGGFYPSYYRPYYGGYYGYPRWGRGFGYGGFGGYYPYGRRRFWG